MVLPDGQGHGEPGQPGRKIDGPVQWVDNPIPGTLSIQEARLFRQNPSGGIDSPDPSDEQPFGGEVGGRDDVVARLAPSKKRLKAMRHQKGRCIADQTLGVTEAFLVRPAHGQTGPPTALCSRRTNEADCFRVASLKLRLLIRIWPPVHDSSNTEIRSNGKINGGEVGKRA